MNDAFRERQLEVGDLSIHCVEAGDPDAPPLLFLHGWPENWEIFREVMRALSGFARVIAIDLPGIGGSPPPPRPANDKAYSRPEALSVGFEWYRAFAKDEQDNMSTRNVVIRTPVLYVRGDKESGTIDQYAAGLRENGFSNLITRIIEGSGHFAPDERPKAVARALAEFAGLDRP